MRRLSCGAQGFTDGRKSKEVFMKIKTKQLFSLAAGFIAVGFAVLALISACDMDFIPMPFSPDAGSGVGAGGGSDTGGGSGVEAPSGASYLTISSLPHDVKRRDFSNVFVYNASKNVSAECADYDQIIISSNSDSSSAKIPLVYAGSEGRFKDSGSLIVSFSIDQLASKSRDDAFYTAFSDGSGGFDLIEDLNLGYFSGGLANPSDTLAPVVKSGTEFEMNGRLFTVNSNTPVVSYSFSNTCIVYVYAMSVLDGIEFFYSTTPPAFNRYKNGYYSGASRALFTLVFIRDSPNKYFSKVFINDGWSHLRYQTVDSSGLAAQTLLQHFYLSGTSNPQPQTVTLPAGVYLISLNGAAGGYSHRFRSLNNVVSIQQNYHAGGAGGHVSEVVTLSDQTSFTFFTGENGGNASYSSSMVNDMIMPGGGGGCGSFAFSLDGYLLCAGGGGGAVGQYIGAYDTRPGGAGGSIGGGEAGCNSDSGPSGGDGGGLNAGSAKSGRNYGLTILTINSYSLGFHGVYKSYNLNNYTGGSAAYFNLPAPYSWLNTNNANGKGGSDWADSIGHAQAGGNNRNNVRGGGGAPSASFSSASHGSITVFKIN
jgi:hypothetical protein